MYMKLYVGVGVDNVDGVSDVDDADDEKLM